MLCTLFRIRRLRLGALLALLLVTAPVLATAQEPAPAPGATSSTGATPPAPQASSPSETAPPAATAAPGTPAEAASAGVPTPVTLPEPDEATLPSANAALLPRDLSAWGMFLHADIIVKIVMSGLAFASLVTWTVALAKALELFAARRRLRAALRVLAAAPSLAEAAREIDPRQRAAALVRAATLELNLSAGTVDKEGVKERVASRLERIEAAVGRAMVRGTGFLATIGATAPFVGLFGTVWGIMNSFIGISKLHTTNLAVVAPGIAEALLATALGLVAAVPAVVIYNMCSRWIAQYRALFADGAAEVLRLVSRDLDRHEAEHHLRETGRVPRVRPLPAAE